jgi:hypothetical protein
MIMAGMYCHPPGTALIWPAALLPKVGHRRLPASRDAHSFRSYDPAHPERSEFVAPGGTGSATWPTPPPTRISPRRKARVIVKRAPAKTSPRVD